MKASAQPSRPHVLARWGVAVVLLASFWPGLSLAQERTGYISGDRPGLEMMVHIIGQVQKPGEYRVADQTDILQLLSKAGGPTAFSRLGAVSVRRLVPGPSVSASQGRTAPQVDILQVNIEEILRNEHMTPPVLQPGDVVFVPKNSWSTYKDIASVLRDLAVVASAYFLYLNAIK